MFNSSSATAMLDRDNDVGSTNPANPAVENIVGDRTTCRRETTRSS